MGHRMSSLPLAQYCGQGPALANKHGAGRAALLSTCHHAKADDPTSDHYRELYARLSPEEQTDIDERHCPDVLEVDGVQLRWAEGHRELAVGLDAHGAYTHVPKDCVTLGHLDFGHVVDGVAYVVDLKATAWTVPEGVASLQLQAYGIAYAGMREVGSYRPGLYFADTGRYVWGEEVDLFSDEGEAMTRRVLAAAQTPEDEVSTGSHCGGCYGRTHCPEYMVPAANADTWLAPLVTGEISREDAPVMLARLEQAKEVVKAVESALKVYAEREGGIPCGDLIWKPTQSAGRKGFDQKRLKADHPKLYEEYVKVGKGFSTFRKVKP